MSRTLVVVGLGYVGLPLAQAAVGSGLQVIGLDISLDVVTGLQAGRSHVDDITDDELSALMSQGFRATTDPGVLTEADAVIICVPTPLGAHRAPDLSALDAAVDAVATYLRPGMLVIVESTSYPGTTDERVRPTLEKTGLKAGEDFHLAFSPERIDPGNPVYGIRNTPKVVGGTTEACTQAAAALYGRFIDTVVPAAGTREAEMAKLLENTYRHINIALVNEMARFCHELEIDLWDVIRCAATKPFGFQPFFPGPGVGGHCIPIDPNYLDYQVKAKLGRPFQFVELAEAINASMPAYVADRIEELLMDRGKQLRGADVLLLGVTYKPDVSDQRESPARPLAERLVASGAHVAFHDPFVPEWHVGGRSLHRVTDLHRSVAESDVVALLQNHSAYDVDQLARLAASFFDSRGVVTVPGVARL